MIRDLIADIVAKSLVALQESGDLPSVELPAVEIERPKVPEHGDYATTTAMKLAANIRASGAAKVNPRALAETIAARIRETVDVVPAYALIERVEVEGPGFINLRLAPRWLLAQAGEVIAAGGAFGDIPVGRGQRVNLEFVSANPTGPVTIGNGRGAFIGDTLGNVMRAAGYEVTKEYYFNDAGAQIQKLGRSVEYCLWRALGDEARAQAVMDSIPVIEKVVEKKTEHRVIKLKDAYFGPFYEGVAQTLLATGKRDLLAAPEAQRADVIGGAAAAVIMQGIRETMSRMHVEFDVWFSQASLDTSGALEEGVQALKSLGFAEERDGAIWAKTSQFGDDKDRVVIRSTGEPTYFASDVAYMRNKFERGFDRLIYILGPDHHGYIGRLKAVAGILGHDPADVHVLIYQIVNLKVGGEAVKVGKRLGNVITLDELDEEVGADITRFFYLLRSNDTALDFDLDLARKQTDENPGLSVQYAHARCAGVFRKATEQGYSEERYADAHTTVLAADPPEELTYELALLRQLLRLEEVVERAALSLEPHHLTRYGMDLADAFHLFYDHCPILKRGAVVTEEQRLARLKLLRAAQVGLARTLTLLGMTAPERMERAEANEPLA
jgi:arginyl-tRNA synthetase